MKNVKREGWKEANRQRKKEEKRDKMGTRGGGKRGRVVDRMASLLENEGGAVIAGRKNPTPL